MQSLWRATSCVCIFQLAALIGFLFRIIKRTYVVFCVDFCVLDYRSNNEVCESFYLVTGRPFWKILQLFFAR